MLVGYYILLLDHITLVQLAKMNVYLHGVLVGDKNAALALIIKDHKTQVRRYNIHDQYRSLLLPFHYLHPLTFPMFSWWINVIFSNHLLVNITPWQETSGVGFTFGVCCMHVRLHHLHHYQLPPLLLYASRLAIIWVAPPQNYHYHLPDLLVQSFHCFVERLSMQQQLSPPIIILLVWMMQTYKTTIVIATFPVQLPSRVV